MEGMDLKDALKVRTEELIKELTAIQEQINQIDQQTAQLRNNRDQLLSKGLEIQGAVKELQKLLA